VKKVNANEALTRAAAPPSGTAIRNFIGVRWNFSPSVRLVGPNPQSQQLGGGHARTRNDFRAP
jgi:hypothetical protein